MSFSTYAFSNGRTSLKRAHSLWIRSGDVHVPSAPQPLAQLASPPRSQGHLELDIPEEYEDRLSCERSDGKPLWRLILVGTTAGFPFLTELYQRHRVKSKIIRVWLEYDESGAQYGQMLVQLSKKSVGSVETEAFFERHGILLELLGYLKPE